MPEEIHETVIIELYSLLSLLLCEAGLKRSIFAVKVSPFSGEYGGGYEAVACELAEEGVQTNSSMGCKPLLLHESTNSGWW